MDRLDNVQPSVKKIKVNNSLQHRAGCIIADVCVKFL